MKSQPNPATSPSPAAAPPSRSSAPRRADVGERAKGEVMTLICEDLPFTRDPAAYAPREEEGHSYVATAKLHPHGVSVITIWNV